MYIYFRNKIQSETKFNALAILHRKNTLVFKNNIITILSIDGGGMRGLIPLQALKYIEQRTKTPIAKSFNLLIGSSTGAVIASGLAIPGGNNKPKYTVSDIQNLYMKNAKRIFYEGDLWYQLSSLKGLTLPTFYPEKYYHALQKYTGNITYNQLLVPVIIPSYNAITEKIINFCNWKKCSKYKYTFRLWQLLAGATAITPLFPSITFFDQQKKIAILSDPSLITNNPALTALSYISKLHSKPKYIV